MGLGHILAGAAQGIGAGMVMQGQQRAEAEASAAKETAAQRREIALEQLRAGNNQKLQQQQSDNRRAEQEQGARLDDWRDSRGTARRTTQQVTVDRARTQNEITLAEVKGRIERDTSAAATRLKAQLDRGEVSDSFEGADGNIHVLLKDGTTRNTGVKFQPKASDGLGGAPALLSAPGSGVGQTPANRPALSSFDR